MITCCIAVNKNCQIYKVEVSKLCLMCTGSHMDLFEQIDWRLKKNVSRI